MSHIIPWFNALSDQQLHSPDTPLPPNHTVILPLGYMIGLHILVTLSVVSGEVVDVLPPDKVQLFCHDLPDEQVRCGINLEDYFSKDTQVGLDFISKFFCYIGIAI